MRKLLTFLKILITAVAVILLFTACQQFLEDPEDFLSYWASETFVKNHSIGSAHRPDGAGVPCVASSASVDITLTVHNPKGFSFVMPTSSAPAGIVEFKELSPQPDAGTDYDLIQTGSGTLKLTYNPSLLRKYEQGSRSLNPTITLKATDGRVFKKTYTFGIKSNTPPPKPEIIIAKTNTSPSKYVLCLKFNSTEMTTTVAMNSGTVPVHKDLAKITINDAHYTLSYKDDNSDFKKPAETSFIERGNVQQLTAALPSASEKWVLYFDTDVKVESSNPQTSYTITLSDKEGVVSDSVTAELKEKFEVKFDAKDGNYTPNTQYILKGDKVTKPSPDPKRLGYIFGGWYASSTFDGSAWAFDTDTVTGNMTLYAKWTEKKHTVKFRVADGEGTLKGSYDDGSNHSQTAQKDGVEVKLENVPEGTQVSFEATPDPGWKVEGWTRDGSPVSAYETYGISHITADTTVTVEFKKVEAVAGSNNNAWKLLKKVVEIADDNATITIDGRIGATSTEENFGEIVINKTLTIKGKTGAGSDILDANTMSRIFKVENGANLILENLKLTGGKADGTEDADKCGGAIYAKNASEIKIENCIITGNEAATNGGGLNVEGTPTTITNCTFTGNTAKNGGGIYIIQGDRIPVVTISGGTIGGTGTGEANKATGSDGNGGGIYVGDRCKVILQNNDSTGCTIKGNTAQLGGGVYANNADVSMNGGTQIAVDNDVYLHSNSWIKVADTLTAEAPVARITPEDYREFPPVKVLDGSAVGSEHAKFAVTPKGDEYWTVGSDGCLTKNKTDIFNNITKDQIKAAIEAANSSMIYDEHNIIEDRTILLGKLVLYKTNKGNYGIMHVTEVDNTTNSGKGHIKFNSKTFNQYGGAVLKEETDKVLIGTASFQFEHGGGNTSNLDFYLQNNTNGSKWFKPLNTAKFYILSN